MKEFKIWLLYTKNAFQQVLMKRNILLVFLVGKILRIGLFLVFLNFLFLGTKGIAGYNRNQIIFFYLSFNLIDTLAQMFFREVYRFRPLIVSGNFDFILAKPLNPLIRVLLGGGDVIDLIVLVLIIGVTFWFGAGHITADPLRWLLYILLVINGLFIAAALHIFVLGIGVATTSIDHLIGTYRDLTAMLRIPVDLYIEPIRALLTFALPLGIMMTFPAKSLMGILAPELFVISFGLGILLLFLSLRFWSWSLQKYQSASS